MSSPYHLGNANQHKMTLDELEKQVRVPVEKQVIELPSDHVPAGGSAWDEQQRQLPLAGGF